MKLSRYGAGLLCLLPMLVGAQSNAAQAYPQRPVRIVVPFEPGGTADELARQLAPQMARDLKQPVVIENRAGANSILGTTQAAQSPADGYTLLIGTSALSLNSAFTARGTGPSLRYDAKRDLSGVAEIATLPYILVVNREAGPATLGDLVEQARANPGAIPYSSSGIGGSPHLAGVLLGQKTGSRYLHVPYKGSAAALMAVMQGEAVFTFATLAAARPHLSSGKLRALAIAAPQPATQLPDVPTIADAGAPGAEIESWFGVLVPAGTPAAIRERLADAMQRAFDDPDFQSRINALGATRAATRPDAFQAFYSKDLDHWGDFVQGLPKDVE